MGVTTTKTNKPFNPRGNDQSPKGYNRAALYSGKALDFDGVNDSIDISNFSLNGYTAFSICFYKTDDFNNAMIFSSADSISDGVNIYQVSPGYFRARLNGFNTDTDLEVSTKKGFFVLTYDGLNLNWYYQAQNIGSGTTSQTFAITNTTSTICRQSYASAQYLNGEMAGFKIFNTALTAAQVADLYNNPEKVVPTGLESNLKLWLPMMEGAGTTAYDGSGNGNHGTISGATYVNGIGAPSPQSAVMDWNKAKNDIGRSQEFDNAYWSTGNITITANDTTAPDGTTTADKLVATSTSSSNAEIFRAVGFGANDSASVFVKSDTAQWVTLGTNRTYGRVVWFDIINGVVGTESTGYTGAITEYTNGWYKLDAYWDGTATTQTYWDLSIGDADNSVGVTAGKSVFAWGAYANLSGTTIGPYLPNFNSFGITSEVLLPQGLTTGRDITGVNLFENVRKQGALNLDGNSWAEVHDNASVDLTTGATLEAWIKCGDELDAVYNHILVKQSGTTWAQPYGVYSLRLRSTSVQWWFNSYTNNKDYSVSLSGWNHLVATKNGTSEILYLNGVQVDTNTGAATIAASDYSLLIGSRTGHSAWEMVDNQLAQPRIYNRALTASEIERNYNAGKNTYTNS